MTRLNPAGNGPSDLLYSTYLGRKCDESAYGLAVDSNGKIYIAGKTESSNFPTVAGSYDTTFGSGNCSIAGPTPTPGATPQAPTPTPVPYPCDDAFFTRLVP